MTLGTPPNEALVAAIEVQDRVIVERRGRMNALPSERERKILAAWASEEDLQLSDSLPFA